MRRPAIFGYFVRLFWWRYVVPHAVWAPAQNERRRLRVRRAVFVKHAFAGALHPQGGGLLRMVRTHAAHQVKALRDLNVPGLSVLRVQVAWALWSTHV